MLLLYAIATKETLVNVFLNKIIVFFWQPSNTFDCIFSVFIKTRKLQNFYLVLTAVILDMAVSLRAANSLLLYALAF